MSIDQVELSCVVLVHKVIVKVVLELKGIHPKRNGLNLNQTLKVKIIIMSPMVIELQALVLNLLR